MSHGGFKDQARVPHAGRHSRAMENQHNQLASQVAWSRPHRAMWPVQAGCASYLARSHCASRQDRASPFRLRNLKLRRGFVGGSSFLFSDFFLGDF